MWFGLSTVAVRSFVLSLTRMLQKDRTKTHFIASVFHNNGLNITYVKQVVLNATQMGYVRILPKF